MTGRIPLQIEAPNASFSENENSQALVPRSANPVAPVTQQSAPANVEYPTGSGKQEIPPGCSPPPAGMGTAPPYYGDFTATQTQAEFETAQHTLEIDKCDDSTVRMKHTKVKTQTEVKKREVKVKDDQGNEHVFSRTIYEQRQYYEIYEYLHVEAKNTTQRFITAEEEDIEAQATCGEKSVDLCCQSLVCHFQNPFKKNSNAVHKKDFMNATLRRGRAKGWTIYKNLITPLVGDVTRDVWVSFQLFFVLVMFCLSISTFVLAGDNFRVFNSIHLAFSTIAAFLAMIDCVLTYSHCSSCKACVARYRAKKTNQKSYSFGNEAESDELTCCRKGFNHSKNVFDIIRVLSTEFILVPIIFCDMFEVATGLGFNSTETSHRIGFALMVFDSIGFLAFVFLVRLMILGRAIHGVQRAHPSKDDINNLYTNKDYKLDPTIKPNSLKIQVTFFLHVFGQMLAQVLMLVAVGAKIAFDNRNYRSLDAPSATPFLWYMMVAAYILPICGVFTFFIVNNYWIQQFLIGLCIDFIKALQILEDDKQSIFRGGQEKRSEAIIRFVRMSKLEEDYAKLRGEKFCNKIGYPIQSPVLVVICMLYFLSQFAFVLCSVFTFREMNRLGITYLNGGGWSIYVLVAGFLGTIINIYSFIVAMVWIVIIAGVIAIVAMVIAFCVCLVLVAASSAND